jgi:hypothetical protein
MIIDPSIRSSSLISLRSTFATISSAVIADTLRAAVRPKARIRKLNRVIIHLLFS